MSSFNQVIAIVFNKNYIQKAFNDIHTIRTIGDYKGIIVCIGGSDWCQSDIQDFIDKDKNIVVESFPDLDYNSLIEYRKRKNSYEYNTSHIQKPFQNHKIYLFHPRMKKYKKIFYIDIGMQIYKPLQPFLDLDCTNCLLAHSDAYPYKNSWSILNQFAIRSDHQLAYQLINEFPEINRDYFQTTTMIYDTSIIKDNTFEKLVELLFKYPFSITNDQAIIALWFEPIDESNTSAHKQIDRKCWKRMNPNMYDYCKRSSDIDYIMTKCK
jgi:hypothetical protein